MCSTPASAALDALADALAGDRSLANVAPLVQHIEHMVHWPCSPGSPSATEQSYCWAAQEQMKALAYQLRAAVEGVASRGSDSWRVDDQPSMVQRSLRQARSFLAVLGANLTPRSSACRHALRLAGAIAVADAITRVLLLPRAYWVPLTVALVLKPDFASTYSRGLARIAGAILGVGVASLIVYVMFGAVAAHIVLLGILMFGMRGFGAANYGLMAAILTALVVVLTSFVGVRPEAAIVDRGLDTVVGGIIALVTYVAWPTWERSQAPAILADLLEAYRRYFRAVMDAYGQEVDRRGGESDHLDAVRLAARLARANAEASVERLRAEPSLVSREATYLTELLTDSHQFIHSTMVLEAGLYLRHSPPSPSIGPAFAEHVDLTLQSLGQALRDPSHRLPDRSILEADLRHIKPSSPESNSDDPEAMSPRLAAIMAIEAGCIVASVSAMVALLQKMRHEREPAPERAVGHSLTNT